MYQNIQTAYLNNTIDKDEELNNEVDLNEEQIIDFHTYHQLDKYIKKELYIDSIKENIDPKLFLYRLISTNSFKNNNQSLVDLYFKYENQSDKEKLLKLISSI